MSSSSPSVSTSTGTRLLRSTLGRVAAITVVALLIFGALLTPGGFAQDAAPTPPVAPSVAEVAQPDGTLPGNPEVQLVQVATGLADPVNVTNAGDGSGRIFVVERTGTIRIVQDGQVGETPFLDLSSAVKTDFLEQGLLGLAFHPNYAENGRFFVYYSSYLENGAMTLEEYAVTDDPNVADPQSARTLFSLQDPYVNHNGGTIKFGPDGYLYVAIGDGGLAGDPYDNAQDNDSLLGKILRLDVDSDEMPYGIPEDNPYAVAGERLSGPARGEPGRYHPEGSPEIWAYGLRNPWQFSFDRENGDLYIADVGQNFWEEINVAPAGEGGQNFGWDLLEATHCYPADVTECQAYGDLPVAEYDHATGGCSITGIGVYRGEQSASLDGIYFNSDYCSGDIFGLTRDDAGEWVYQNLLDTSLFVTGSGEDEAGELYITTCSCAYGRDYNPLEDSNGMLWQLVAVDQVAEDAVTAPTPEPEAATDEEATTDEATPEGAEDEGGSEGTPEATPES